MYMYIVCGPAMCCILLVIHHVHIIILCVDILLVIHHVLYILCVECWPLANPIRRVRNGTGDSDKGILKFAVHCNVTAIMNFSQFSVQG